MAEGGAEGVVEGGVEGGGEERWLPLESNPEVLSSFLRRLGVPAAWTVQDVLSVDPELLVMVPRPALGLMLLFPITPAYRALQEAAPAPTSALPAELYYMKQTVSNACGTVALLHCVANAVMTGRVELEAGSPLAAFLAATAGLSPEERAVKLETDAEIVRVHDEAAREGQTAAPGLGEEVEHHYVALVEVGGVLWELDGRRQGPVAAGVCGEGELVERAAAVCREYMARDPDTIAFTVLALAASD